MAPAPVRPASAGRSLAAGVSAATVCAALLVSIGRAMAVPLPGDLLPAGGVALGADPGHLLVSEVMTGGAGASDEFIEIYNPTASALPLEGLEVVYVTASGATVTRKATWAAGAPMLEPGAHLLITNEAGVFAALGDVTYANGLSATGGSVALRIQGAASGIDAVGWGTAASNWLETRPAAAPAAGSSLERLPGGAAGSTQDTDDNLVDFAVVTPPDPQNSTSAPVPAATATPSASPTPAASDTATPSSTTEVSVTPEPTGPEPTSPGATPTESATATPPQTDSPSPSPSATVTPSPTPSPIAIAVARALPDGTQVTIEGVALTDSAFSEGGGYLADASGGIAVLLSDGQFSRGQWLRVSGTLDDRYAQRTIRSDASGVESLGTGAEPLPQPVTTGAIAESVEGQLVAVNGVIAGSQTQLSGAIAVDLDDGSGLARVVVMTATGIVTDEWIAGASLDLVAVVGQRDASGTGSAGYRVQPRDPGDIGTLRPPATPAPTPTPTPFPSPTPSPSQGPSVTPAPTATPSPTATPAPLVPIAEARAAATGTRLRVRGVVTLPNGVLDAASAVVQDSTGAILVRLGDDAGALRLGQLVELDATRSTRAGMLSLRVTRPALVLGSQADPDAVRSATGTLSEALEARLVLVRGAVTSAVTRSSAGSVSFSLDDGSGPIRVFIGAGAGISPGSIVRGSWVEVRGVLGQETTGREPERGYRVWPRTVADIVTVAGPIPAAAVDDPGTTGGGTPTGTSTGSPNPSSLPRPAASTIRFDAPEGGAAVPRPGFGGSAVPVLARAVPTGTPIPPVTDPSAQPVRQGPGGTRAAGMLASGFGLALLAGGIALGGRRVRRFRLAEARGYTPPDSTANARTEELPPP